VHDEIVDIANAFYSARASMSGTSLEQLEEDNLVRRVLGREISNSRHFTNFTFYNEDGTSITRGVVYEWHKSLPSGHPMTSITNSMYNSIQFRLCWIKCYSIPHMPHFRKEVALADYGDDNVFNCSDKAAVRFNQDTLPGFMAQFGMEFTNELKTGTVATMRTIEEVSFLKRRWRFEGGEVQRYVAPLELSTIREMPYWYRQSNAICARKACEQNVCDALMEYSLHDPTVWDTYALPLIRACGDFRNFQDPIYFPDTRRVAWQRKALNLACPWARALIVPPLPLE
jgi:hypothetical protein